MAASNARYAAAEAEAKAARAGLAGTFDEPAEWRKSKRVGEVAETPAAARATDAPAAAGAAAKSMPTTTATSCKAVRGCREAVILWCSGYSRADADSDGIPCENVCKSLAQVEPFKKEIGCDR